MLLHNLLVLAFAVIHGSWPAVNAANLFRNLLIYTILTLFFIFIINNIRSIFSCIFWRKFKFNLILNLFELSSVCILFYIAETR